MRLLTRSSRGFLLWIALLFLLPSGWSLAETYHVDAASGDDGASGASGAPWKTLNRAVGALKAGDTLLVGPGLYREEVHVKAQGTAEKRITIKGAEGAMPVLSGSDRISDWQPATKEAAGGNPEFGHIRVAVIDWAPTAIFEAGRPQPLARTPNEGWWPCEATSTTVKDPQNLTQATEAYKGATVFFFRYKGVAQMRAPVSDFDPATKTLTLGAPLSESAKVVYTPGSDRYRLENKATMIDRPGEWAWEDAGEGKFRIFYWPVAANTKDALIEIPRRPGIIGLGSAAYCTVEGFELVHALKPGRTPDSAIGGDVNKQVAGSGVGLEVRKCSIHHNGRFGFQARGYQDLKLVNNLVYLNEYGVSLGSSSKVLIEGNEIAENLVDGLAITWGCRDVMVRRNYVHHHNLYGHPDNIQMYRDVKDVTLDSNLVLSAGQSFMMEQTDSITVTNNVIVGSAANMMICGHNAADNYTWKRNTMALWASSLFNLTGKNYSMSENIWVNNGGAIFYSIPAQGTFESDRNILWAMPGLEGRLGGAKNAEGKTTHFSNFEDVQAKGGQEKNSAYKDPGFKNAPVYCTTLDGKRIGDCTREKLYLGDKAKLFQAGDFIEVHFDGVVRKVASVDSDSITLSPPLEFTPDRELFVVNWKEKDNFQLDFSTPLNDQFGSTVNVPAFMKGDFNGDGVRDIPAR